MNSKIIELEKQKVKTKNKVLGGSPTKTRMEAVEDAAIDPTLGVIGRAMAGDPVGAASFFAAAAALASFTLFSPNIFEEGDLADIIKLEYELNKMYLFNP